MPADARRLRREGDACNLDQLRCDLFAQAVAQAVASAADRTDADRTDAASLPAESAGAEEIGAEGTANAPVG